LLQTYLINILITLLFSASDSNGNSAPPKSANKPGASMDLMSELNNKLKKRNNQAEVTSVTSAASTSSTLSTNSSESVPEKRSDSPPPKPWQKSSNASLNTAGGNVMTNGVASAQTNGVHSPKVHKK
jgi:hypothetical protein